MTEKNWVNLPFERVDVRDRVGICDTCPLACSMPGQIFFVPFEIVGNNPTPDVLFVAEAPFKDEIKQQRPLIGKAGSFLRDVLDQYIDSYALANVVCCHPTNTAKIGVRTPLQEEQEHCVEHVKQFINEIQPKLIVLLGKIAYMNILPDHYIESVGKDAEYVGKMQKKGVITSQGITYACSYHPSYITRSGGFKSNVYVTFNSRIKQVLKSLSKDKTLELSFDVPEDDLKINFVSMDDLSKTLLKLEPYDEIGLDFEARTLDPWFIENKPTGFSMSIMTGDDSGISYYIVIDREFTEYEREILVDFLRRKACWAYNAKYESNMAWATFGKHVKFNDTFSLAKIDNSPTSLKLNCQKYLGTDLWEEEVHSIVAYYEFIFGQMAKQKNAYPEIVELLKSGRKAEACELIKSDEKILKKFAKLLSSCDSLLENITEDDFTWGLTKFPYAWAAVPTKILGEYCCWDSYLTVKLKRLLWKKHSKQYQYYITQTWLAGNMEAYGYNWNDSTASRHTVYYIEEANHCLYELIKMIDVSDEDLMTAEMYYNDPDPEITPLKRLLNLKKVFNPLSNVFEKQEKFWKVYRTPFTETIAFLKYLHLEIGQNDVLNDDIFLPLIKAGVPPEEIVLAMTTACGTSRRQRTALDKIFDGLERNLDFYFRRFAIEITSFHYEAHTEFGGVDIDDRETWNRQFLMMYYLKRFKKVLKVDSTYIWGRTGRKNVWLSEINDRGKPPRRITNYYDTPKNYILKPNERWVLNADFFECGADTKRWRAGIHCLGGDTKIQLSDNTTISIEDLYRKNKGNDYKIITYLNGFQFEFPIKDILISGETTKLIEVSLENGTKFLCTPEHRLLKTDGTYIEAKDITDNTDLEDVDMSSNKDSIHKKKIDFANHYSGMEPSKDTTGKHNVFYVTCNQVNGKLYFGVHRTDNLGDNYLGSGLGLQRAIDYYGVENFNRKDLVFFSSFEKAFEFEKCFLTYEFLRYMKKNKLGYNISEGGRGSWNNKTRLEEGTHPFIKTDDFGRNLAKQRVDNGTNPFLDEKVRQKGIMKSAENNRKLAKENKHPFQNSQIRKKALNLLKEKWKKEGHPLKNVKPWDTNSQHTLSQQTWCSANKIYKTWKKYNFGYTRLINLYKGAEQSCRCMVKMFKEGWIPSFDSDWIDWKMEHSYISELNLKIEERFLPGPWTNPNANIKSKMFWCTSSDAYQQWKTGNTQKLPKTFVTMCEKGWVPEKDVMFRTWRRSYKKI